jgi:hypothetical protein
MKIIRVLFFYGLAFIVPIFFKSAWAVEPINFTVRNNADLVALCSTQPNEPNFVAAIHFCHGFGVGFARYHDALKEGKDFEPLFCFPETVTRTQALTEYVHYSKAHPEYDREAVGDVVTKFLIETYPCKAKTK